MGWNIGLEIEVWGGMWWETDANCFVGSNFNRIVICTGLSHQAFDVNHVYR